MRDGTLKLLETMKTHQLDIDDAANRIRSFECAEVDPADVKEAQVRLLAAAKDHPYTTSAWEDAYHALEYAGTFRVYNQKRKPKNDAERALKESGGTTPSRHTNPDIRERVYLYAKYFHHNAAVYADWSAIAWDCLLHAYVACDDIRLFMNH